MRRKRLPGSLPIFRPIFRSMRIHCADLGRDIRSTRGCRAAHPVAMKVVSYSDAERFWLAAGPLLLADPVGNTLMLSLTRRVRLGLLSEPILLTVHDGPDVIGAALRTPGYRSS